jgi:hypothetical protein
MGGGGGEGGGTYLKFHMNFYYLNILCYLTKINCLKFRRKIIEFGYDPILLSKCSFLISELAKAPQAKFIKEIIVLLQCAMFPEGNLTCSPASNTHVIT